MIKTIEWTDEGIRMIDQRKLPMIEEYPVFVSYQEVAEAIRTMVIRGAPAIGVAAAMGIALGMRDSEAHDLEAARVDFQRIAATIAATRPTAINLFWAVERMTRRFEEVIEGKQDLGTLRNELVAEALAVQEEDIASNKRIGTFGCDLMPSRGTVLTHCNAGALATAGYGTALGVIRAAVESGKHLRVLADETRPVLQGARLTAWELSRDRIDVRVISDSMCGSFMNQGIIDVVIVGADRIAANGDVANKIGTYSVAVLAKQHAIPFYVAAPTSTIDLSVSRGNEIPIEQRDPSEITNFGGLRVVPEGVGALNPAFDVTPRQYVTAIVTDYGVAGPPYEDSLLRLVGEARKAPMGLK